MFSLLVKLWVWSTSPSKDPRVPSPTWGFCSRSLSVLAGYFLSSLVVVSACWADAPTSSLCSAPNPQPPFPSCAQHCGHDQGTGLVVKPMEATHKSGCFCRVILKGEQFLRLVQSVATHRAVHQEGRGCLAPTSRPGSHP